MEVAYPQSFWLLDWNPVNFTCAYLHGLGICIKPAIWKEHWMDHSGSFKCATSQSVQKQTNSLHSHELGEETGSIVLLSSNDREPEAYEGLGKWKNKVWSKVIWLAAVLAISSWSLFDKEWVLDNICGRQSLVFKALCDFFFNLRNCYLLFQY